MDGEDVTVRVHAEELDPETMRQVPGEASEMYALTVRALRKVLEGADQDAVVMYVVNAGDTGMTAEPVQSVMFGTVGPVAEKVLLCPTLRGMDVARKVAGIG